MLFLRRLLGSSRSWSIQPPLARFYSRHPLVSNCLIYGSLYAGAELSQQTINHVFTSTRRARCKNNAVASANANTSVLAKLKYDIESVKRYIVLGTCVYPPVFYAWYKWLDATFKGSAVRIVGAKVFLDQFVLGPPSLFCFFVLMSWLEGKDDVLAECRLKFSAAFAADCVFWIPVQAANFMLVPAAYRVSFIGVMAFVWLNILCVIKNVENYLDDDEDEDK